VKTAAPLLFSDCCGSVVLGEGQVLNVTFPVVGVPNDDSTFTVTVTLLYGLLSGTLIIVVVGALFTFCVKTGDVDPAKFALPL
jgi:hypothetical protein